MPDNRGLELLSIGAVAERTGLAPSAIRFYEEQALISAERNRAGHRRFRRATIRRLSFILIAQRLGYRLEEIKGHLAPLPVAVAPTDADWNRLAEHFGHELDARIDALADLREKLDGCIGCGCLSLDRCALYNEDDHASVRGAGPRYLMGDSPEPG